VALGDGEEYLPAELEPLPIQIERARRLADDLEAITLDGESDFHVGPVTSFDERGAHLIDGDLDVVDGVDIGPCDGGENAAVGGTPVSPQSRHPHHRPR
jgi:hypothetical protein